MIVYGHFNRGHVEIVVILSLYFTVLEEAMARLLLVS